MTITAGVISLVQQNSTSVKLAASAATGGTGPYTYQWYMSTTSNFTPGGGNILSGETALTLTKSGLVPGVTYYFKVIAIDTGHSNDPVEYAQYVDAAPPITPSQNQFQQSPVMGQIDLRFDYNTVSGMIDSSQLTPLYAGSAVKRVNSAGGVPKLIGCTADENDVFGFINFDIKSPAFLAGMAVEVSQAGNCMYLLATGAIDANAQVVLDEAALILGGIGAVKAAAGITGANIIGWAYDKAVQGQVFRVMLTCPSYKYV